MNLRIVPLLIAVAVSSSASTAQQLVDPRGVYATRSSLQDLLAVYEGSAESPAYSSALRDRARYEARLIRQRLDDGDFQVGDRVWLRVENEPALTDTFQVANGRVLRLPVMGEIPLAGVLRAELRDFMRERLERFIRDPRLEVRSLIRMSITGAVTSPGFYTVPTEALLTDALMLAGGPTPRGDIGDIQVERGGRRIWGGQALQDAIIEGRTVDQLSLKAGDRIDVPEQSQGLGGAQATVRTLTLILSIPLTVFALTQIF